MSYLEDLPGPLLLKKPTEIIFYNKALLDLLSIATHTSEIGSPSMSQANVTSIIESKLNEVKQPGTQVTLGDIVKDNQELMNDGMMFEYSRRDKVLALQVKSVKIVAEEEKNQMIEYVITDVTTIEELQKSKAQEKCFKILIATASHDIMSPLNVISGVLDIVEKQIADPNLMKDLELAKIASKRMEIYLKGLSFLQQIESGQLQIDNKSFICKEAIEEMIEISQITATSKQLVINKDIKENVPENMCTDRNKYQMILHFLLRNAIKYTFEGRIGVTVSYDVEQHLLYTTVEDTGAGISEEMLPKLFQLFTKINKEDHLCPQGIGMGLYLCKSLSHELNGNIDVKSIEGKGTRITFYVMDHQQRIMHNDELEMEERICVSAVPRALPMTPSHLSPTSISRDSIPCACNKVLIVDDEPSNIMILSNYLGSLKLTADKAYDGQLAIKMITERKDKCQSCRGYRLVLMDINMPVMDGIDATKRIRELLSKKIIPHVDVVAVTAAAQLENSQTYEDFQKIGFTLIRNNNHVLIFIVQKPVRRDYFLKVIKPLLS